MNHIPAASGTYFIRNTQTDCVYIGASKHMRVRVRAHARALAAGTHTNKKLQAEYTANPGAFVFEVGELVTDADQLQDAENRAMELHAGNTYNRKPSNMRQQPQSEKDMQAYRAFMDWRVLMFARLPSMDRHILQTLADDLQGTLDRIAGEIARRAP